MSEVFTVKQCVEGEISVDHTVTVQGWVKTRRDSKAGLSFISLQDGSCFSPIQIVAVKQLDNYEQEILKLTSGCAIIATGKLVVSQGKGQSFEVQAEKIEVIGWVENPDNYPIQAKRHTLEFLREVAHLRPRTNTIGAATRIRHCLAQAIHRFFHEKGYFWIHTPIITASDCEGAGELFRVSTLDLLNLPKTEKGEIDFSKDFFGRETYLTVSGQLNAEAYCLAMSKVYTFGPTFRAENSNTSRHLAEFWMIEPELAFATLADICDLSQSLLRYLCKTVLDERPDDMDFFNQFVSPGCIERLEHIVESDFEIMTYTDAITALEKAERTFEFPVHWGLDLQSEHERYLAEELCKKPVIITDYPKEVKGFYMRLNDDGKTVAAMDVLAPGIGEIIGGSQREERLHILDQRMDECHLDKEFYHWYRDLRRYGTVPHAGFGLGFERLISYVTGLPNVRDVIPFPRTPGHVDY
ncbi:asparagine--tRNA ligase [Legionella israelensis]|uniref:Asparagine--tRNA ligase n=1 Tax=Legionella israelensis TaxID=454 RepID=A0A0W0V4C1_9GAMM|nr:asparagine--tRNA ligase [Legionella israelensis]KTD14974.1 asparaginyl tRNA synthetase [Legionella israelensis]QBR85077.1 asparagine--tRNA ligase [Legionella israelensis]QBS10030.1 asparagine--tRNA ligase [Legionella israelensis]SCX78439.1 asparaginyl-tRNA synthetase [Legionella israelensis DSM 19235]STX59610.1 asparaginyl tRNA synthetase [Legionella israelensis]